MVPYNSTAEEVSFEWYSIGVRLQSQVRTTLHVSVIASGSERVRAALLSLNWKNKS